MRKKVIKLEKEYEMEGAGIKDYVESEWFSMGQTWG